MKQGKKDKGFHAVVEFEKSMGKFTAIKITQTEIATGTMTCMVAMENASKAFEAAKATVAMNAPQNVAHNAVENMEAMEATIKNQMPFMFK